MVLVPCQVLESLGRSQGVSILCHIAHFVAPTAASKQMCSSKKALTLCRTIRTSDALKCILDALKVSVFNLIDELLKVEVALIGSNFLQALEVTETRLVALRAVADHRQTRQTAAQRTSWRYAGNTT